MSAASPVEDRLWNMTVETHGGCWLWLGTTTKSGHGLIKYNGKNVGTHVISWKIANDECEWPSKDQLICHTCDIPNCVNPKHLYLGTKLTNNRDAFSRNPGHGVVKLTQVQVDEIRSLSDSYSQVSLARKYGVHQSTINRILNYRRRSIMTAK